MDTDYGAQMHDSTLAHTTHGIVSMHPHPHAHKCSSSFSHRLQTLTDIHEHAQQNTAHSRECVQLKSLAHSNTHGLSLTHSLTGAAQVTGAPLPRHQPLQWCASATL